MRTITRMDTEQHVVPPHVHSYENGVVLTVGHLSVDLDWDAAAHVQNKIQAARLRHELAMADAPPQRGGGEGGG